MSYLKKELEDRIRSGVSSAECTLLRDLLELEAVEAVDFQRSFEELWVKAVGEFLKRDSNG